MTGAASVLKPRFHTLVKTLAPDAIDDAIDAAFDRLCAQYLDPPRFYHTLEHVADVLAHLDILATASAVDCGLEETIDDAARTAIFAAAELAIFYHDAIYDATRKDNEARSADMLKQAAKGLHIPAPVTEAAARAVLATAAHMDAADEVSRIVVDCDLHVLAIAPEAFNRNSALIAIEYAHVPPDIYATKRRAVFAAFLAAPALYKTPLFQNLFEDRARRNIMAMMQNDP